MSDAAPAPVPAQAPARVHNEPLALSPAKRKALLQRLRRAHRHSHGADAAVLDTKDLVHIDTKAVAATSARLGPKSSSPPTAPASPRPPPRPARPCECRRCMRVAGGYGPDACHGRCPPLPQGPPSCPRPPPVVHGRRRAAHVVSALPHFKELAVRHHYDYALTLDARPGPAPRLPNIAHAWSGTLKVRSLRAEHPNATGVDNLLPRWTSLTALPMPWPPSCKASRYCPSSAPPRPHQRPLHLAPPSACIARGDSSSAEAPTTTLQRPSPPAAPPPSRCQMLHIPSPLYSLLDPNDDDV